MAITAIWCQTPKGVIGLRGALPWKIKEEMNHFKHTTLGNIVLMGRKTYEHIHSPLIRRDNIVLTKNLNFKDSGVNIMHSVKEVLDYYKNSDDKDLYIAGGKEIYKTFLPYCDKLIISILKKEYIGDTYIDKNFMICDFKLDSSLDNMEFKVEYYTRKVLNFVKT